MGESASQQALECSSERDAIEQAPRIDRLRAIIRALDDRARILELEKELSELADDLIRREQLERLAAIARVEALERRWERLQQADDEGPPDE